MGEDAPPPGSRKRKRSREDVENGREEKRLLTAECQRVSKPFPFLKIPAELRNRIYEFAVDISHQSFPTSTFTKEHQPGLQRRYQNLRRTTPIPFLGLTQSCRQIREEFRPLWLQTHQVTLGNIPRYLKTFFPARAKSKTDYYAAKGQLKVYLRHEELENRDLLPLIKHDFKFPNREVILTNGYSVPCEWRSEFEQLLRNRHPQWVRLIQGNMISQVRVVLYEYTRYFTIVMREKYVQPWMKENRLLYSIDRSEEKTLRDYLGVQGFDLFRFQLSIDYR